MTATRTAYLTGTGTVWGSLKVTAISWEMMTPARDEVQVQVQATQDQYLDVQHQLALGKDLYYS